VPGDGHGYEVLHDGKVITVFSASNYGGNQCNTGAVLVWADGQLDAHEFSAINELINELIKELTNWLSNLLIN